MKAGKWLASFVLGAVWATLLNIACWINYLGWTYTEYVASKRTEMEFNTSTGWFLVFGLFTVLLVIGSIVGFWDED